MHPESSCGICASRYKRKAFVCC